MIEIREFETLIEEPSVEIEWGAVHPDSGIVWSFSDQDRAERFAMQYRTKVMKRVVTRGEWAEQG